MAAGSLFEAALRRERLLVAAGLLALVGLSWLYLLSGAGTMEEMGGMLMPMSSGPWTPAHAATMLAMWAVMMMAMMLPSAAPTILLYATIARNRRVRGGPESNAGMFTLGYLAVWLGFSVAAVVLQYWLEHTALLSPMMQTTSIALAAAVLIGAGLYQWTPLKHACLRHCRSPLDFLLEHWREGRAGALRMGMRHGAYCLGCCWVLMLLLFVGGIMNLVWVAAIALFVLVEKLAPGGHGVSRAAGLLLVLWGVAMLLTV